MRGHQYRTFVHRPPAPAPIKAAPKARVSLIPTKIGDKVMLNGIEWTCVDVGENTMVIAAHIDDGDPSPLEIVFTLAPKEEQPR